MFDTKDLAINFEKKSWKTRERFTSDGGYEAPRSGLDYVVTVTNNSGIKIDWVNADVGLLHDGHFSRLRGTNDVGDEFFNHFKYTGIETFAVKLGALSSNGGWFWQALQAKEFDRAEQAPSNNWILLRVYGAANGQPFIVHVHSGYIEPPKVIQTSEDRSCFIAHAAFNDTLHPTVVELRRTRDEVLARSIVGRRFIQYYYKKSPKVAGLISERPAAQAAARLMLTPIAGGIRRARSISSRIRSLIK